MFQSGGGVGSWCDTIYVNHAYYVHGLIYVCYVILDLFSFRYVYILELLFTNMKIYLERERHHCLYMLFILVMS